LNVNRSDEHAFGQLSTDSTGDQEARRSGVIGYVEAAGLTPELLISWSPVIRGTAVTAW
jgi:hypothetical protein